MLVKRIAAYTPIFNCLRAIARYWSEIATFSYPLHLKPPYGVAPGTIAVNVTRLERGFNACKTPRYIYIHLYSVSSQAQDRESSPVKDQRSTTVLRHQLNLSIYGPSTRLVETHTRQRGPCWRVNEIGHPSTRAVNSGRQLGLWKPGVTVLRVGYVQKQNNAAGGATSRIFFGLYTPTPTCDRHSGSTLVANEIKIVE